MTGIFGLLLGPVGTFSILRNTSNPSITCPVNKTLHTNKYLLKRTGNSKYGARNPLPFHHFLLHSVYHADQNGNFKSKVFLSRIVLYMQSPDSEHISTSATSQPS